MGKYKYLCLVVLLSFATFAESCYYTDDDCSTTTDLEYNGENAIKISSISPENGGSISYGDNIKVHFDYTLQDDYTESEDEDVEFTLYLIDGDEEYALGGVDDDMGGGYEACYYSKTHLGHVDFSLQFMPDTSFEPPYTFRMNVDKVKGDTLEVIEVLASSNTWILN